METQYGQEVQKLYKSSTFRMIKDKEFGTLNQKPWKTIVSQVKKMASLLTSLVLSVGPTTLLISHISHVISMKFIPILVIIYKLAHPNNNNYILLFIEIYLYSAGT